MRRLLIISLLPFLLLLRSEAQYSPTLKAGIGPPTEANCTQGTMYTDINVSGHVYVCQSTVNPHWIDIISSGTGALFPNTSALVVNLTTTTARNATSADITNTLGYFPVNKAGDTMSGNLTVNAAFAANSAAIAGAVTAASGVIAGPLTSDTVTSNSLLNGVYTPNGGTYTGDICQRWQQVHTKAIAAGQTSVVVDLRAFTSNPQLCSVNPFANVGTISGEMAYLPPVAIFKTSQWTWPSKFHMFGIDNLNGLTTNSTIVDCNMSQIQPGPNPCSSSFIPVTQITSSTASGSSGTLFTATPHGAQANDIFLLEGNGNDLDSAWYATTVPNSTQITFPYTGSNTISGARSIAINTITSQCGNYLQSGQVTTPPYADWVASGSVSVGQLIIPLLNNAGGYIYQVSTGGTSSGTEPSPWNQTVAGTQSDGSAVWTNLGQPCVATFALASAHGVLAGGFPLTVASTGTVLDGSRYIYTINPGGNQLAFTMLYLGAPITLTSTGTVTITPQITRPSFTVGNTLAANSSGVDQGIGIENVTLDSNDIPGSIGVFSSTMNEGSGIFWSELRNAARRGYLIMKTSNGFPANWSDGYLQIYSSQLDAPATNATVMNCIPTAGYDVYGGANPMHSFHDATIRPLHNRNPCEDAIDVAGVIGGSFANIHAEIERHNIHFTGASASNGIFVSNVSTGFGQVYNLAGLYGAVIRNDSTACTECHFDAIVSYQSPYTIDDSQGGHSFAGGTALVDNRCAEYVLDETTANPMCNKGTASHVFQGPFEVWTGPIRLRTSAGTFEGQMSLDGANNIQLTGASGQIYICPAGGSTCSGAGGIANRLGAGTNGFSIENSAGTQQGFFSMANIASSDKTWTMPNASGVPTLDTQLNRNWYIPPAAFATSTMLGPAYFEPVAVKITTMTIRNSGTTSCSAAPVVNIMDLGTSPSTLYGSATSLQSLTGGTVVGVTGTSGLSVAITAGHYIGVALSAGTCATPPQMDVSISLQ